MALEPYREVPTDGSIGYNYVAEIITTLDVAMGHFQKRGQLRKVEILDLQKAFQQINTHAWEDATLTLRHLWSSQSWRNAGWWKLLQGLGWAMLDCLKHATDGELLMTLLWELSNEVFDRKPGTNYDLQQALTSSGLYGNGLSIAIDIDKVLSPLVATFVFLTHEVFVGESLECQLAIHSHAQLGLPAVRLSEIEVGVRGQSEAYSLDVRPRGR